MNSIKNKPSLRVWVKPSATFPPFAQPTVVSYFSLDQDRRFTPNTAQLRYMHLPRGAEDLGWDLSHGLDKVQRSDHAKSTERIDNLLRGLLSSGLTICPEAASFMCLRGLLTRIMTTPYEQNQGWEILVSKFRGVLFMCAQETPDQRRERMGKDDAQKRFCSWGFKFEQYMTTDQPGCPPDTDMPVKEGEEFCCLFRTKLNDRRLIYGAEMDAVTSDVPLEDCLEDLMCAEFVELKTSRKLTCVRQERNFKRFKLLNWWAQNFLVNVAHIICGFRDDRGIVENIAFYKVDEIPKMARDLWVPAVCMTFLDQFLSFVGKTVWDCPQSNDPNTTWRFRWEPGVHYVTGDMIPGRSQFSFLPDWFLSSVVAMNSHPLDFRIPIYSSRRGKNSISDDQRAYTTKILTLAKAIALQRSRSKRSPSPRTLMISQRNHKPPLKETGSSTSQSAANEASSSTTCTSEVSRPSAVIISPSDPNVSPPAKANAQACPDSHSTGRSNSNVPEINALQPQDANGPSRPRSQPRTNRRRTREDRSAHLYPTSSSKRATDKSDRSSFPSSNHLKNSHTPRSKPVKLVDDNSESVPSFYDNVPSHMSVTSDILRPALTEESPFSSNEFPSASHVEEVVYASLQPLESDTYLVSHPSSELSPSTSVDQYTSQAFLSSSSPEDSYPQHELLSSSLSSPSMIADSYSPHTFSDCDDLPQTTYVVSSNSEFMHQESYLQSPVSLGHPSQPSYLSSPTSSEYTTESSFLPVATSNEIHSSQMFVNETEEDLTSSSLLPSVASISQTFIHSSSDISSDDIQTAEGSLSTINQLSSSAYLPPSSSEHLTLRM